MFGYITVNREDLKVRELDRYQAWYCGLCHALHRRCGRFGQMTLTYDMTFLAMLLSSLYEVRTKEATGRCIPHPLKEHRRIQSRMTDYAADMNVLLACGNLKDDWQDDKKLSGLVLSELLKQQAASIRGRFPRQAAAVDTYLEELGALERRGEQDIEAAAVLTGRMLSEIFVIREDRWAKELRQMGFFLGKFVYLIDAYEDIEKDAAKGSYNPLAQLMGRDDFDEICKHMLMMQISACCKAFEVLPIIEDAGILRNILYSGVWTRFAAIYRERQKLGDST